MKVPSLDLKAQLGPLRAQMSEAILEVLDSTQYIMGPQVEKLEAALADYCNVPHAIGVSSGTDALLVSLMALQIEPGDLVLTTPYSFFATAGAISRLNAIPVFVDIDAESYNIDPNAIELWFSKNNDKIKSVKAIIVVHLYGQCADMRPILKIAENYNIPVIEDAAQAIGATYPNISSANQSKAKAGSMGEIGCFSFFPSKNLGGIGDGGMVTCKDSKLAERIRLLRNHGAKPKYYNKLVGGNFRLDTIQAAVLLIKLPYLETWHEKRRANAQYYINGLKNLPLKTPKICFEHNCHIFNQFVISVDEKRDELRDFLAKKEIGNEIYYPVSFHEQECFKCLGYVLGDFPNSEYAARHSLAIPVYPELQPEQLSYIVSTLREFYE